MKDRIEMRQYDKIFFLQHHKRLKKWMDRFQGVATKYLDNYLFWYRFLELNKKMPFQERVKEMLLASCHRVNFTTVTKLRA
jgi:hypothetical protein